MSQPRSLSGRRRSGPWLRRRRRRHGLPWGLLLRAVVGIAVVAGSDIVGMLTGDDDSASTTHDPAVEAVLLTAADLGGAWAEEEPSDSHITISLTDGEADCLAVEATEPEAEGESPSFTQGPTTLVAHVAVWPDEGAAARTRDVLTSPAYPPCLVAQIQREAAKDYAIDLLGAGPTAADPTVHHIAYAETARDGWMDTAEVYQAFVGRTQVWLLTWSPAGVDQRFAVSLVQRMAARAR